MINACKYAQLACGGISMRRLFPGCLALGLLFGFTLVGLPQANSADPAKKEEKKDDKKGDKTEGDSAKVKFTTLDQVELHGTFYPSTLGQKASSVILLHNLGGDSKQDGWDRLAQDLQKNYAVLTFDFRGHGNSTSVDPAFWKYPQNQGIRGAGSAKPKATISYKDFQTSYYPRLVDDIAAAKAFLDRKNDANECNSSSIIVIGAEEGATLGAMWMASEFSRHKVTRTGGIIGIANVDMTTSEGKSLVCAVWLSISPKLRGQTGGSVTEWLKTVGSKENKVPMYFIHGAKDTAGETYAKHCEETLKAGGVKLDLTGKKGIADTKLTGNALLGKALDTTENVVKYVDKVVKDRGAGNWEQREFDKSAYCWVFTPGNVLVQAKREGEKALMPLPLAQIMRSNP